LNSCFVDAFARRNIRLTLFTSVLFLCCHIFKAWKKKRKKEKEVDQLPEEEEEEEEEEPQILELTKFWFVAAS
jgi:hypothetical protein